MIGGELVTTLVSDWSGDHRLQPEGPQAAGEAEPVPRAGRRRRPLHPEAERGRGHHRGGGGGLELSTILLEVSQCPVKAPPY